MPIRIHDPMTREIAELVNQSDFKWYMLLDLLERYYSPIDLMRMLQIGRTSYYAFKKSHDSKYVERKLFEYYNSLQ